MLKSMLCVVTFSLISSTVMAGPYDPIISTAWVGESVPEQTTATLQLNLTTIKPVELISVSSPFATNIEIQRLMKYKGKMKMTVVRNLRLPGHSTTIFGSQGLFLMMTGIKQPLKMGEHVPLKLIFKYRDKKTKTISAVADVKQMELSYKHYGPNEVYDHH